MVKVIADSERSGSGRGMLRPYKVPQMMMMTTTVLITMAINTQKGRFTNFGMAMIENHSCKKGLHMYYVYGSCPTCTRF